MNYMESIKRMDSGSLILMWMWGLDLTKMIYRTTIWTLKGAYMAYSIDILLWINLYKMD